MACRQFIDEAEHRGWQKSNISATNSQYSRKQSSVEVDTTQLLKAIRKGLPDSIENSTLVGLIGERTRCFKYCEGEHFGMHTDAPYTQGGIVSKFTLVIYLNDDFGGGETVFPANGIFIKPETGKALLFSSDVPHAANPVKGGPKYILRSEVAYAGSE